MRFNDKELAKLSESKAGLEGVLHHMKPQENDWSDWYQQPSFKERVFKLISNLLFYYRVNESEALGVLVLENAQVMYERPHKGIPFAFSITFKVSDKLKDSDQKHIFSCRCQEDVNKWVSALKVASYEHWRLQYIILKTKINMRTGQDPVLDYTRKQCKKDSTEKQICNKKSTFQSYIETRTVYHSTVEVVNTSQSSVTTETSISNVKSDAVPIDKLIDI